MIINYLKNKCENDDSGSIFISIIVGTLVGVGMSMILSMIPTDFIIIFLSTISLGLFFGLLISALNGRDILVILLVPTVAFMCLIILTDASKGTELPLWAVGIILLIITEILFLLNKTLPSNIGLNNNDLMWFTTKLKIEAFIESLIIFASIKGCYRVLPTIDYSKFYLISLECFGFIFKILIIVAAIYAYIWINSRRYKQV